MTGDTDFARREQQLRIRAGKVMEELKASGGDWQQAWRDHPVAHEYRALLREVWRSRARIPMSWRG